MLIAINRLCVSQIHATKKTGDDAIWFYKFFHWLVRFNQGARGGDSFLMGRTRKWHKNLTMQRETDDFIQLIDSTNAWQVQTLLVDKYIMVQSVVNYTIIDYIPIIMVHAHNSFSRRNGVYWTTNKGKTSSGVFIMQILGLDQLYTLLFPLQDTLFIIYMTLDCQDGSKRGLVS